MPGEFDFISWIRSQQRENELVKLAAGDDLAILKWPANDLLLVGCDQVLDGVHFDSKVHPPRAIGRKAMNRNLSDCAAMACLPAAALVSVALPRGTSMESAKELYLGIKEAGDKFNCPIVGGETGSWDGKLAVTITILGRSDGIAPVTRAGAKPGHLVHVTGWLGGSLLRRHMDFEPMVKEARMMAKQGWVTAMIDLSDGLSRDLRHICEASGVGAEIRADAVPIHDDAVEMRRDGHSPLEHALHDGEDYELLFASTRSLAPTFGAEIGRITAELGIWLVHPDGRREALEPKGWEHTF
jgi:thiamine-monophosphate kinase